MNFYSLILIFALVCIFFFVLRIVLAWKSTGKNPITFQNSGSAHDYLGKWIFGLIFLILLHVFLVVLFPSFLNYFVSIPFLVSLNIQYFGFILGVFSLIFLFSAQMSMGKSWSIGIEKSRKTALISRGFFRMMRHPIYFGYILLSWSFFLMIPTAVSLLFAGLTMIVLNVQARLEEKFLLQRDGKEYENYMVEVKRWGAL